MKSKRTRLEIFYDMLRAAQNAGGTIKPTHLLYKSNLSHKKLEEFSKILMDRELLEVQESGEKRVFVLTDKGLKFLSEYKVIADFTEAFGL